MAIDQWNNCDWDGSSGTDEGATPWWFAKEIYNHVDRREKRLWTHASVRSGVKAGGDTYPLVPTPDHENTGDVNPCRSRTWELTNHVSPQKHQLSTRVCGSLVARAGLS